MNDIEIFHDVCKDGNVAQVQDFIVDREEYIYPFTDVEMFVYMLLSRREERYF